MCILPCRFCEMHLWDWFFKYTSHSFFTLKMLHDSQLELCSGLDEHETKYLIRFISICLQHQILKCCQVRYKQRERVEDYDVDKTKNTIYSLKPGWAEIWKRMKTETPESTGICMRFLCAKYRLSSNGSQIPLLQMVVSCLTHSDTSSHSLRGLCWAVWNLLKGPVIGQKLPPVLDFLQPENRAKRR